MKPGDYFTVRGGAVRIPAGGYVCLWALESLMPVLAQSEANSASAADLACEVQCPDPKGRVVFRIASGDDDIQLPRFVSSAEHGSESSGALPDLRVVVEEVGGKCTLGMAPGDGIILRSGRIYIPADQRFCLYALQAVLPLLPAKQRALDQGDWLREESRVICPDPSGSVIMRIERYPPAET